jgi:hypothetical protein
MFSIKYKIVSKFVMFQSNKLVLTLSKLEYLYIENLVFFIKTLNFKIILTLLIM